MNEANESRPLRWFQFSLRTLLTLTLAVAAYFAGFGTSEKLAENAMREARDKAAAELGKATTELEKARQAAAQTQVFNGSGPPVGGLAPVRPMEQHTAPMPLIWYPRVHDPSTLPDNVFDASVPEDVK